MPASLRAIRMVTDARPEARTTSPSQSQESARKPIRSVPYGLAFSTSIPAQELARGRAARRGRKARSARCSSNRCASATTPPPGRPHRGVRVNAVPQAGARAATIPHCRPKLTQGTVRELRPGGDYETVGRNKRKRKLRRFQHEKRRRATGRLQQACLTSAAQMRAALIAPYGSVVPSGMMVAR